MAIQEMEEKNGVDELIFSEFRHKPQNKQKMAFFGFKRKNCDMTKKCLQKVWYDIWSFSYKQQILNFWSKSEMVKKLRFRTGWSENCVFAPPGEPILSKILKNYFFMISFISFNNVITFLKHLGKMTFLRVYLPINTMKRIKNFKSNMAPLRGLYDLVPRKLSSLPHK